VSGALDGVPAPARRRISMQKHPRAFCSVFVEHVCSLLLRTSANRPCMMLRITFYKIQVVLPGLTQGVLWCVAAFPLLPHHPTGARWRPAATMRCRH
jgi:hypothetical protein